MSNFVVIDHSIKRIGGHNFEYAFHVLSAAEQQGYEPMLAVNRRFFERQRLPAHWRLFTQFRHTTYEAARLAAKQRQLDPDGVLVTQEGRLSLPVEQRRSPGFVKLLPLAARRFLIQRYEAIRREMIDRFAEDLALVFGQLGLRRGDHVFLPTLSEDDLAGLLVFFCRNKPAAGQLTWHLQFHFSVCEGREADGAATLARRADLQQLFGDTASALPIDRVRFYTTTDILARQFNRLGAATFQALPYPVNPGLLEKTRRNRRPDAPLRVTCAGGVRPEKGTAALGRVVAGLWSEYFDTQRLQLVVQAKRLGKLPRELRGHARYDRATTLASERENDPSKVAVVRWPLSTEKYLDLIRESDIGLLLYDADQYYARCSGVMVEMLKAGVPVIVPAGCWMADQIAEPIFAHRDGLCRKMPNLARLTPADADWEAGRAQRYYLWRSDARLLVGGEAGSPQTRLAVPSGATHLCVQFRFGARNLRGSYLEVSAEPRLDGRPHTESLREVVGIRTADAPVPILLPVSPAAREVQLRWQNAFGQHMIELLEVEFLFLAAGSGGCPLGAVGLISAGLDQAPRLLRDLADHYAHYRQTAESFAPAWGDWHSPEKVVRLLSEPHAGERRNAA